MRQREFSVSGGSGHALYDVNKNNEGAEIYKIVQLQGLDMSAKDLFLSCKKGDLNSVR